MTGNPPALRTPWRHSIHIEPLQRQTRTSHITSSPPPLHPLPPTSTAQLEPPCRPSSAAPLFERPRACAHPKCLAAGPQQLPSTARGRPAKTLSRRERSVTPSSTYAAAVLLDGYELWKLIWHVQVLLAIMSGVFGLAGWHFCTPTQERSSLELPIPSNYAYTAQLDRPPALPPSAMSPRSPTASRGRKAAALVNTSTLRAAIPTHPRRMLLQH